MILRKMNEREQWLYDNMMPEHPWMADIKMTDEELEQRLVNDLGNDFVQKWFAPSWNDHWLWVAAAVFKHFYECGEFVNVDRGYLDGQTEYVIDRILNKNENLN